MFKKASIFLILLGLFLIPLGCSSGQQSPSGETPAEKVEIMVSAAASLTDALNELKTSYEKEHQGVKVTYIFGSSGKLATQIEKGAPSDVFLSASKKDMDSLEAKDLIQKDSRIDFTENALVLITKKDSSLSLTSFEEIDPGKINHFAIGEPEIVPVGRYTKEVFEKLNLWEPMQSKIVLGSDVRQVLTYVESGNAEAGVVYFSDAKISDKVKVLAEANQEWHKPIVYPGAVVADTKHVEEAKVFLTYLLSEQGKEILNKYGFR